MRSIDGWFIDQFGSIRGVVIDSDGKLTAITTSRVVDRNGNIVRTRNGSHYELLSPSSDHMNEYVFRKYFDGAKDALAAVDHRILHHD